MQQLSDRSYNFDIVSVTLTSGPIFRSVIECKLKMALMDMGYNYSWLFCGWKKPSSTQLWPVGLAYVYSEIVQS